MPYFIRKSITGVASRGYNTKTSRHSNFAYVDKKGRGHLPLENANHVRNAISRFEQTHFEDEGARQSAWSKIQAAAKQHGIHVSVKKAHVKTHTRKLASGKVVQVKEYDNTRKKKTDMQDIGKLLTEQQIGTNVDPYDYNLKQHKTSMFGQDAHAAAYIDGNGDVRRVRNHTDVAHNIANSMGWKNEWGGTDKQRIFSETKWIRIGIWGKGLNAFETTAEVMQDTPLRAIQALGAVVHNNRGDKNFSWTLHAPSGRTVASGSGMGALKRALDGDFSKAERVMIRIQKAKVGAMASRHLYIKRTGLPGSYDYVYPEELGDEKKATVARRVKGKTIRERVDLPEEEREKRRKLYELFPKTYGELLTGKEKKRIKNERRNETADSAPPPTPGPWPENKPIMPVTKKEIGGVRLDRTRHKDPTNEDVENYKKFGEGAWDKVTDPALRPDGWRTLSAAPIAFPDAGYAPATVEKYVEDVINSAAKKQHTNHPNLTSAEMLALPGMNKIVIRPTSLDDIRDAVWFGLHYSKWYDHIGEYFTNTAKNKDIINEAAAVMATTSPRAQVTANVASTWAIMYAIRKMQHEGTLDFTEITEASTDKEIEKLPIYAAFNKALELGGKTGENIILLDSRKIAALKGYATGKIVVVTNAKTPSFYQNIVHAQLNQYDAETTVDVHQASVFGIDPNEVGQENQAYRTVATLNDRIAREFGITPREAQAAAWYTARLIKESYATSLNIGRAFGDGRLSTSEAMAATKKTGVYEQTLDVLTEIKSSPLVDHFRDKFLNFVKEHPELKDSPAKGKTMSLFYPGEEKKSAAIEVGDVSIPLAQRKVGGEESSERNAERETQSPVLYTSLSDDMLKKCQYNAESHRFDIIHAVHRVELDASGRVAVSFPGGNANTVRYFGALVNKMTNSEEMVINIPDNDTNNIAGFRINKKLPAAVLAQIEKTVPLVLHAENEPYIQVPITDQSQNDTVYLALKSALQTAQLSPEEYIEHYTGDIETHGQSEFDSLIKKGQHSFGADERQNIQNTNSDSGQEKEKVTKSRYVYHSTHDTEKASVGGLRPQNGRVYFTAKPDSTSTIRISLADLQLYDVREEYETSNYFTRSRVPASVLEIRNGNSWEPFVKARIKGYTRTVNGKAVFVHDYEQRRKAAQQRYISVSLGHIGTDTAKATGVQLPEELPLPLEKVQAIHNTMLEALGYDAKRRRLRALEELGIYNARVIPEASGAWGTQPEVNMRIEFPKNTAHEVVEYTSALLARKALQDAVGIMEPDRKRNKEADNVFAFPSPNGEMVDAAYASELFTKIGEPFDVSNDGKYLLFFDYDQQGDSSTDFFNKIKNSIQNAGFSTQFAGTLAYKTQLIGAEDYGPTLKRYRNSATAKGSQTMAARSDPHIRRAVESLQNTEGVTVENAEDFYDKLDRHHRTESVTEKSGFSEFLKAQEEGPKKLPKRAANVLRGHARHIWLAAYNAAKEEYGEEDAPYKVAWAAVKHKYHKGNYLWQADANCTKCSEESSARKQKKSA